MVCGEANVERKKKDLLEKGKYLRDGWVDRDDLFRIKIKTIKLIF